MCSLNVGLDSQCLSYLLDAINDVIEPTDALALEKRALIRSWFYMGKGTFFVTGTVMSEVANMRASERRHFHESFVRTLFHDYPVSDAEAVAARALQLKTVHAEPNDCLILAEAEELGLDVLLTYDRNFRKRLKAVSPTVQLLTPNSYWDSLLIPKGSEPRTVPHRTNPLSTQTWWRW